MAHHVSAPHPAPPPSAPDEPRSHPRVMEPVLLVILVVLSAVGAVIGIDLVSKLGISANTSVVGALSGLLTPHTPAAGPAPRVRARPPPVKPFRDASHAT
ncbi:hypothetical protein [Streptomyces sp. NPDC091263]|uniref:hypothetical protein n=1 Tax=Streptomyces sp. NPDC091263 TaxID=3155194 RepID=UPI00344DFA98